MRKVQRSGPENIMALCPFHPNTDSPAFALSLSTGLWFCFSCQARGNLRTLLRGLKYPENRINHEFGEILRALSSEVTRKHDPLRLEVKEKEPLDEGLLGLFNTCPLAMLEMGYSEEILQAFEVGYDPTHQRITFPLRDLAGNLVGVSGRALSGSNRYKLYDSEYLDFGLPRRQTNKSIILWNLHNVLPQIHFQRNARVVLVEGFKACIRVAQAGITEVVALLGSSMTDHQKWLLAHLGASIYLMLDNNEAGWKGTRKIGTELAPSLDVKVVPYQEEQPSDLAPEVILSQVNNAIDYYTWSHSKDVIR
jgi:DNA primase